MPIYEYECPHCGPMDLLVPLEKEANKILCPICEHRAMISNDIAVDFSTWSASGMWTQDAPKDYTGDVPVLRKLVSAQKLVRV